jgi:hypothetical protein
LGGWLQQYASRSSLFWVLAVLSLLWIVLAWGMREPPARGEQQAAVV